MDIDVGKNPSMDVGAGKELPGQRDDIARERKETKAQPTPERTKVGTPSALKKDRLESEQISQEKLKSTIESNHPRLSEEKSRYYRMSDAVRDSLVKYDVPSVQDLMNRLSAETRQMILEAITDAQMDADDSVNPRKYFDMLSKMLPLTLSLLYGLAGTEKGFDMTNLKRAMFEMMKETVELMAKNLDSSGLSPENKARLRVLAEQLTTEKGAFSGGKNENLTQQLADADVPPPSTVEEESVSTEELMKLFKTLHYFANQMEARRDERSSEKSMEETIRCLSNLLDVIKEFPQKTQADVVKVLISTQPILTSDLTNRALGPHTLHLAQSLSLLAVNLSQKMGIIPDDLSLSRTSAEYLSRVFAGLIVVAGISGRLVVDRGDGKAMNMQEAAEIGKFLDDV